MNIFAVSSIWEDEYKQLHQQMTLSIAASKEVAKYWHIEEVGKQQGDNKMILCNVVEATPEYIKAVYQHIPNQE